MNSDWRLQAKTLIERNEILLKTGLRSDCSFLVGGAQVPIAAHKLILSTASEVFERMFYGTMAEKCDKPILVEDINAADFDDLLKYVYCDDTESINSMEKAINLMYAAEKYMIHELIKKCSAYMIKNLKSENVLLAYEAAKRFDDINLAEACLECIRNNTTAVLLSPELIFISLETLLTIVEQPMLRITSELEIFNALDRYADAYNYFKEEKVSLTAEKQENSASKEMNAKNVNLEKEQSALKQKTNQAVVAAKEKDANNVAALHNNDIICAKESKYQQFQKILKKVRFLTLNSTEFSNGPAISQILEPKDALAIFACIVNATLIEKHFPKSFVDSKKKRF